MNQPSRTQQRAPLFTETQRITLLENDADNFEEALSKQSESLGNIQKLAISILVALVVACILMSINIILLRGGSS